jgi:hypothetical protein
VVSGENDEFSSATFSYFNDAHQISPDEHQSSLETKNSFPPFFYTEGVFSLLVVPYLFLYYFPHEFIDSFLVTSLVRSIVDIATGCDGFSICREDRYDVLFDTVEVLRTLNRNDIRVDENERLADNSFH